MRRADLSMLTIGELRLRKRKRLRRVRALVLLIVLGLGVYFGGRPTLNAVKGWQARRHALKAFDYIEQEKWKEAKDSAVAAYQLRSTEPEALRAVARLLSRTRQQQALEFWDQLAKKQPLTRDDRRDEATVALVGGELDRAATAVDHLLAGDGKEASPLDWLLATQLRLQLGTPEKALEAAEKILTNPAATPREQFQATLLQLQAARTGNAETDAREQRVAWQRLNKFAQGDDAAALDSLVLLAQRELSSRAKETGGTSAVSSGNLGEENSLPDGTAAVPPTAASSITREELIRRLESHPLAKAPPKLLASDLQMQAQPKEREALISRAIAEWKDADVPQLAVLATWLNGKGEFQRLLDVIPLERAIQSRDLFLQLMDALGALGRWDEIKPLLDSDRFPLDPVIQRMYLARCSAQLGQKAASDNNWQRALEAAGGDIGKLVTLADYAEKNGAAEIAESAYTQATGAAPKLRAAWQGRLRTTYASRDTKRIHAVLAGMLKLWPNDTAIQNDEAYTRLLLLPNSFGGTSAVSSTESPDATAGIPPGSTSEQLTQIEKLAEELVQREPSSLPHRTLLALSRLKQGRPVAAQQVYDGIQALPNALTPSAIAVHAAVLEANGRGEDARAEIAQAPPERLLVEEQLGTAHLRSE